jgi:hypothetical protein
MKIYVLFGVKVNSDPSEYVPMRVAQSVEDTESADNKRYADIVLNTGNYVRVSWVKIDISYTALKERFEMPEVFGGVE